MENYHLTKEQQFQREDQALRNVMDREAEKRNTIPKYGEVMASIKLSELLKLREDNAILLSTMKEIAVPYPNCYVTRENDKILCRYLIARAQEAIRKVEPDIDKEIETLKTEVENIIDKSKNLKK